METNVFQNQERLAALARVAAYNTEKLARLYGSSSRQFRRIFHATRGCPPREYLNELRVAEAIKRLLALAAALVAFRSRTTSDDADALTCFLDSYPDSAWKPALLLNLGIFYRHSGWFTKALDAWEQAWALAKSQTEPKRKNIADTAVTELLVLNARLGRYDRLESLLSEIKGRQVDPALLQDIDGAREGLWLMRNRPEAAFRCGPMALAQIGPPKGNAATNFDEKIYLSRSTPQGMSLAGVCDLARSLGMDYQMAWRPAGSAVVLPAVVHWKAGHYAALVKQKDGQYLVSDPTFGDPIWISQNALDHEASGYCLVSSGELPANWRSVDAKEGQTIFGKGDAGKSDKSRTRYYDPKTGCWTSAPMAQYAIHLMLVSINVMDTPVGYTPPRGPDMHFQVTYNQKEGYPDGAIPPSNFGYSNLGAQWTFNWMAYIVDDPANPGNPVYAFLPGGGFETFTNFNSTTQSYAVQPDSQTVLKLTSSSSYERDFPDGSKQIFSQSDGSPSYPRRIFMTQAVDPQGNTQTFTWNSVSGGLQLVAVTDAIGQVTTITNGITGDSFKITGVTDPFGRAAIFKYNGSGQLTNITDIIGINSAFTYDTNGTVVSVTTPYGTSTFAYGTNTFVSPQVTNRMAWCVATDPLGGQERVEYDEAISSNNILDYGWAVPTTISGSDPAPRFDEYRNTFYWDKKAISFYPDYTKAKIYHWCHTADINTCSGVLESTKTALEGRVWNTYPGQTASDTFQIGTNNYPATVARVLDDGSSQIYQYQYNLIGKPTLITDPTNRQTGFIYAANNVDLLTVYQMTNATASNVLASYTYNSKHLSLTAVDAAGQTNFFGYNANGQLVAMTNVFNEIVLFNYYTNSYLSNIVAGYYNLNKQGNPTNAFLSTNSFTFDLPGRVHTVTDPLGYTITNKYDAADRLTNVDYMDGSYARTVYNYLDPVLQRDRNGHWTAMAYDPLRHMTDVYDNLGRHTQFAWCNCGSLTGITDPLGHVTQFIRDLESRVAAKVYPDLTQTTYAYETNSSRLKTMTDAKNQSTTYSYYIDNDLKQVTYSDGVTPPVSFTYDTNYNRMVTMTDGTGTTTHRYYNMASGQFGAGQVSSVSNSFIGASSLISYNYDALGRITNRAINGISQQVTFDHLHRVTMLTNALGGFTNAYVGGTMLISTNFAPFGKKTIFSYLSIANNERLSEILNQKTGGVTLSKFDYSYDSAGNITNWTQQTDANTPNVETMRYDPVNELLSATVHSNTIAGAVLKQFMYGYDISGNRTSASLGTPTGISASSATFNSDNQMVTVTNGSGPAQFAGSLDKQGTVVIAGTAATMNHFTTNFVGYTSVTNGTNVVPIIATDYGNHSRTNKYQIVITNAAGWQAPLYDADGNMTNDGNGISYEYDAVNRTTAINRGNTNRTEFLYDGIGCRVQEIEKTNGVAYITNKFVWCGMELCEQRDNTGGNVVKRFFGGGEQISGTNYFFTRDHLGSIREMVDSSGTIQARYDYDPYGVRTKIQGARDADFGFTGHFMLSTQPDHTFTLYRLYRPDLGRWLSRDPIGELGALNLYEFVDNDPIANIDLFGLRI